ncbi:unnamed protein product [Symbiodinium sp. CCMP2592]|nr:unnamed protein product [Symbiodinium sp. CCMP2592]
MEEIVAADTGEVVLLRVNYALALGLEGEVPWAAAYCVLKRPGGLLLVLPAGYLPAQVLLDAFGEGFRGALGPHTETSAPAVELVESGEWAGVYPARNLSVLLADFSEEALVGVETQVDGAADMVPSDSEHPNMYPLATALVTFATSWTAGVEGDRGAGYVTAEELVPDLPPTLGRRAKGPPVEPKRKPTVAQLAAQQSDIMQALQALSTQVQSLASAGQAVVAPTPEPPQVLQTRAVPLPQPALAMPVSAAIAASPAGPKKVSALLGAPPRTKAPLADLDGLPMDDGLGVGPIEEEPLDAGGPIAAAVLAQSRALTALVAQMASSSDPLSDLGGGSSSLSTKGSAARLKLQKELAARNGSFFEKVQEAALRRMDPASGPLQVGEDAIGRSVMCRYLERYGGFRDHRTWGLVQWQLAQIFDLLGTDQVAGAKDALAMLMVMVDQMVLDSGSPELGWILTLQPDPPSQLFSAPSNVAGSSLRPCSHLSDPRWVATALSYVKEMETLASRRAEVTKKPSGAPPPDVPPKAPGSIPPNSLPYPDASNEAPRELTRVFGAYKSDAADRQIGDRRGANGCEGRVDGAQMLTCITTKPGTKIIGASTDRADFYHQAKVSCSKAEGNAAGPRLRLEDFEGTETLRSARALVRSELARPRPSRPLASVLEEARLVSPAVLPRHLFDPETPAYGCFRSVYQGDHVGVEYGTEAHGNLLEEGGLLLPPTRLLAKRAPSRLGPWEGLIIDDYYCLSSEPASADPASSEATRRVRAAHVIYERDQVQGSPHKDILGADFIVCAGAQVDSSDKVVKAGCCFVSAATPKLLALSVISLKTAAMPAISEELASNLAGSWISALMFRRPLFAVLDGLFGLGKSSAQASGSGLRFLPRKVAQELVVLASLAPVLLSNVAAPFCDRVFCSDASMNRGATCSTKVPEEVAASLWLAAEKKGCYTMLDGGATNCIPPDSDHEDGELEVAAKRPLAFDFDVLLIFEGAAGLAVAAAEKGLRCSPVIDPRHSPEYDLRRLAVFEWALYLIWAGKARSIAIVFPAGLTPCLPKHRDGRGPVTEGASMIFKRSVALLKAAVRASVPAVFLYKKGAGVLTTAPARNLLAVDKVQIVPPAIGAQGSLGQPGLAFCPTEFPKLFWASRSVPQAAASGLVSLLQSAVSANANDRPLSPGLENIAVNEVLLTGDWQVDSQWAWKRQRHINCLETEAAVTKLRDIAREGRDSRPVLILDSSCARGALAKGRSSAKLLRPSLRRAAAISVAGGIFPAYLYGPTRLNVSDDPTRDVPLREPHPESALRELSEAATVELCTLSGANKSRARWVRLCLLLVPVGSPREKLIKSICSDDWRGCPRAPPASLFMPVGSALHPAEAFASWALQGGKTDAFTIGELFDLLPCEGRDRFGDNDDSKHWTTGAYAQGGSVCEAIRRKQLTGELYDVASGEGPLRLALFWTFVFLGCSTCLSVLSPRNPADVAGFSLDALLSAKPLDAEAVSDWVVRYGRDLYGSGRPYWHYSETINAVTSLKPVLRRQVQAAWDLGFAWLIEEPTSHHTAIPAVILIAILSASLAWGWTREAGCFALAFGGLLRIGEVIQCKRSSLVLPSDVCDTQKYILVRIEEPKTRHKGPRHQTAKVEAADLVSVTELAFEHFQRGELLWPLSPQTLRKRLDSILKRIGASPAPHGVRELDLGSFTAGGATYILQQTEDSELVRRRGRWASAKVMEVYLQEISANTFLPSLPRPQKDKLMQIAGGFTDILRQAWAWKKQGIQSNVWYNLWYPGTTPSERQAFFKQVEDVFGELLMENVSLNETSVAELQRRNQRLLWFASDYAESTKSSARAWDARSLDNQLKGGSHGREFVDFMAQGASKLREDRARNEFLLVSMSSGPSQAAVEDALKLDFLPDVFGAHKKWSKDCAESSKIPNMTSWCPESLMDWALLSNYYNQRALDFIYNLGSSSPAADFPNAIYINTVDAGGLIRTGTAKINPLEEESRVSDDSHAEDGYAYSATLIAANVRRLCRKTRADGCDALAAGAASARALHPVSLWEDSHHGRLVNWPVLSPAIAVI